MNTLKKFLILNILFFISFLANSQEFGSYFLQHYTTQDYKADAQNWAISQDDRGVIYVGNTSRLLEFDGKYWRHYYNSTKTNIRSIDIDTNGIIYVGSSGEFGYFKADNSGKLEYFSISDSIKDKNLAFQDIWKTSATPKGVFFFADNYIFRWKNNNLELINHKSYPFYGNFINNKLYIIDALRGLYVLEDTVKTLLENTITFVKKSGFIHVLEHDDPNKLFIISSRNGLYEYNLTTSEAVKIESVVDEYINKNYAYAATKIDTDLYAIGTSEGGILIINGSGDLINIINKKRGLPTDFVYYLFVDKDKNLWAGLQNGICRIDINYPIQKFGYNQGIDDYTLDAVFYNNNLFLASMGGSYYLNQHKLLLENDNQTFTKFNNTDGIWDLFNYQNFLFGVGYQGIFQFSNDSAINILNKGDIIFTTATTYLLPDYLFLGTKNGLSFVNFKKSENGVLFETDSLVKLENINDEIRFLTTDKQGKIWISTKYTGIFLIKFFNNNIHDYQLTKFTKTNGLIDLNNCKAELINGEIKILTTKGILKPVYPEDINAPDSLITFVSDEIFGKTFTVDSFAITEVEQINENKFLFFADNKTSGIIEILGDSIYIDSLFLKRIPYISKLRYSENNKVFICSNEAFYIYDLNSKKDYNKDYQTLIRKVTINSDSIIFNGTFFNSNDIYYNSTIYQTENFIPKIKYNLNSITLEYSSNFYEDANFNLYSYVFENYDENWSAWSTETRAVLTNIPEGTYTFKVKAKNVYGIESQIGEYKFIISPPWHRTWWALIIWITFILFILFLLIKANTIRLERKNRNLEKIVQERTAELTAKNIEVKRQNEELQQQKEEILSQSEELSSQSEELQVINHELEKLSIVASETDNAVLIFNNFHQLEWINNAFNRLYGYSFEEIQNKNITELSSNENISQIIDHAITCKKSVAYEALILTKKRENIWIHTTVTPIFDFDGRLNKLIVVESNIHDLKLAQKEIALQNKLITSSIYYAVSIQNSILPYIPDIKKDFEFFVIFRPKDIVSGDFYWYVKTERYYFIAVIDCTGHGVPGAFMSLIGNRLINEVVLEKKVYETSKILNSLDYGIRKALRQETTENVDGMDVSLCRIEAGDNNNFKIQFTGARQPLLYFSVKNNELVKIKGDIRRIGGFNSRLIDMEFTNNEMILDKGDIIYLKSDGYEDQCDFNRKKYGKGKLKRILAEIALKPIEVQKNLLEEELNKWQSKIEQRDDITILGLKL